jgi:MerR family transcriptional regulator, copper efflux regulator
LDHIGDIAAKIAALSTVRDAVQELADKCEGNDRPECPILRDLEGSASILMK